ncbi:MAG: methylmalonyl-CoA epimerase [Gaiellales bacterium]
MQGAIGIHHLGIAVADLDAAAARWAQLIGAVVDHGQDSEELGTRALALRTPEGPMIELVAPFADDTPVGRFLAKRGEGMHHVAYEVADIAAEVERLVAEGVDMIDERPRPGLFGLQVAFIHPEAVQGVLLELVQPGGSH